MLIRMYGSTLEMEKIRRNQTMRRIKRREAERRAALTEYDFLKAMNINSYDSNDEATGR